MGNTSTVYRPLKIDDDLLEDDDREKKPYTYTLLYFLCLVLALNFLAIIYVLNSRYIYFWDNATYWDISRKVASGAINEGGFWKNVYNSVAQLDYNYVAALPSALLIRLFGQSRLCYVLGLVNLYLVPFLAVIYHIAHKMKGNAKCITAACAALCPVVLFLTLAGYVDMGGALMALICFDLYYPEEHKPSDWYKYVIIGVILVFMMVWRRWYSFFSVAFLTAMAADCFLVRERKWHRALISILSAGAFLVLFFRDFITQKLLVDYGTLYQSYKFNMSTDLKLITRHFGVLLILALLAASVIYGVKKKEKKHIFIWMQLILSFSMFVSTQTHSQHHLLLYAPGLIVLSVILLSNLKIKGMQYMAAAFAAITLLNVFVPRVQPQNIKEIKHYALIPDFSLLPRQRSGTEEIVAFKRRLDSLVGMGEKLGVLASSFDFNEDILRNAEPSLNLKQKRVAYITTLPQVDSRDTNLSALYDVDYVVVVTPAQTHLLPGTQNVVECAVESFENWTDFAQSYEELYDYLTNIDGMTIKVFRRVREVPDTDKLTFEARLKDKIASSKAQ